MTQSDHFLQRTPDRGAFPFPVEWIDDQPWKVEESLARMSPEEQAQWALRLRGKQRQDFLVLSPCAAEVIRHFPPEEVYQMVKETGEADALPVLSIATAGQLQYLFDLEWWFQDKFNPERALHWIEILDHCGEPQMVHWLLNEEEFEQKVVLLQSLTRIYKRDELTDTCEGVEGLPHFTLDGVYDIFCKISDFEPLRRLLLQLRDADASLYMALMEAVIWYPVTPTVENALRWHLARTAERGIPSFEEALEIYSRFDSEVLKTAVPSADDFQSSETEQVPPSFPLMDSAPDTFFRRCVQNLERLERMNSLQWELTYLANKILVADRCDPASLDARRAAVRKMLGYVNIGLESGAEGDVFKGTRLLEQTWMQALFQAGYGQVQRLRWAAQTLVKEHGKLFEFLLAPGDREQMMALLARFPRIGTFANQGEPLLWRDLESLADIHTLQAFLARWKFFARFSRLCLDLTETRAKNFLQESISGPDGEVDIVLWTNTAWARFILFKEISCQPLADSAAQNFLKRVFLPPLIPGDGREINEEWVEGFRQKLISGGTMAWTAEDREFLAGLIDSCRSNVMSQFSRLNPGTTIDWQFTHGLVIAKA